jgi:hypothetical protein
MAGQKTLHEEKKSDAATQNRGYFSIFRKKFLFGKNKIYARLAFSGAYSREYLIS